MNHSQIKKIAFITSGDPTNRKGFFNNVQERATRLMNADLNDLHFDFYMIRHRDSFLFSLIRRKQREEIQAGVKVNSIEYRNLWVRRSFIDYLFTNKFKIKALMCEKHIKKHKEKLGGYDLIIAHGHDANYLAYKTNEAYGINYITSWHGSDINVMPIVNPLTNKLFKKIIENAATNLFVSKRLLKTSESISTKANKEVLYTGPADIFVKQSIEQINKTKANYGSKEKQVVGFIGNLKSIKNIKSLPAIFKRIVSYDPNIQFWVIGNGELEQSLRKDLEPIIDQCKLFGKIEPNKMPDLLNAMDLLVLPSLNEGLPRVTLEALVCGVPVVGSDVGGIPEVIGDKNVFSLDDDFENNIANRAIEILKNNEPAIAFPQEFSWSVAENKLIKIIEGSMS